MGMTVRILGSSSSGNCYLFDAGGECLAVECGVGIREAARALSFNVGRIVGAVVTHAHGDHAGHAGEFLSAGVPVLGPAHAIERMPASPFARGIEPMHGYRLGGFAVYAFPVRHDVPCMGYVVSHESCGRCLYVTDTDGIDYTFAGLEHIFIEANYSREIIERNLDEGRLPAYLRGRIMRSHMELGAAIAYVRSLDLSHVADITLIHLSAGNSDAAEFRRAMEQATGIPTRVADAGMIMELGRM